MLIGHYPTNPYCLPNLRAIHTLLFGGYIDGGSTATSALPDSLTKSTISDDTFARALHAVLDATQPQHHNHLGDSVSKAHRAHARALLANPASADPASAVATE